MPALSFHEARHEVLARVRQACPAPQIETAPLSEATGRVLAQPLSADRDYPPLDRSMRDGFAVQAAGTPGAFTIAGSVRAGERFERPIQPGEAVEIMTGAPVPEGADAVVMIEHVTVKGPHLQVPSRLSPETNVSRAGCDAHAGDLVLAAGARLDFAHVALLAALGQSNVSVFARPTIAILATGDELVPVEDTPGPHQIRNSNTHSLAAQVRRAGGIPLVLPVAPDAPAPTQALLERGLESDLLLIAGGVSAGRYDVVEQALESLGAEFYFDRVLIQPGQPAVFGHARDRFFFGLPGNPASTMVCFEVFARAALELLSGIPEPALPITEAPLTAEFRHKPGLTRFLPARLEPDGRLQPVPWSGSGDLPALARANCWLVADAGKADYAAGDRIGVLMR